MAKVKSQDRSIYVSYIWRVICFILKYRLVLLVELWQPTRAYRACQAESPCPRGDGPRRERHGARGAQCFGGPHCVR